MLISAIRFVVAKIRRFIPVVIWLIAALAIFGCPGTCRNAWGYLEGKTILVLASYHVQSEWEQHQIDGLLSVLPSDTPIVFEYLDAERFERRKAFIQHYEGLLVPKHKNRKYSVIVALNDPAILVARHYLPVLWPTTPLVVGGSSPDVVIGTNKIHFSWTGVFGQPDVEGTIIGALKLHPAARYVKVYTDLSSQGWNDRDRIIKLASTGRLTGDIQVAPKAKTWKYEWMLKEVRDLPEDGLVYWGYFYKDFIGQTMLLRHFLPHLSAATRVPIYSAQAEAVGHGAVGGIVINGREMGVQVGYIVNQLLAGEEIENIPLEMIKPRWVFDGEQLRRWAISESVLPAESQIINRQMSWYERNWKILWGSGAVVFGELVIIVLLLINRAGRLRAQRELQTSEQRFRGLYEVSDELFMIMDERGNLLHGNPATERITGMALSELLGRGQWSLVVPGQQAQVRQELQKALTGTRPVLEVTFLNQAGEEVPLEFLYQPMTVQGRKLVVCFARNLSERYRLMKLTQEISERERQNMGQDIHDELGHYLTALNIHCHRLISSMSDQSAAAAAGLNSIIEITEALSQEVRNLARALVPFHMLNQDLRAALMNLVRTYQRHPNLEIKLEYDLDEKQLESGYAAQLYRIAQEAVRNAIRHARARIVIVVAKPIERGRGLLMIENDGTPFSQPDEARVGLGLTIMKQRTQLIRGKFSIASHVGLGTRIECLFPYGAGSGSS